MCLKDSVDECLGRRPCLDYFETYIKAQKREETKHFITAFKTRGGKLLFMT